jgi:hypothetical protein
MGDFRDVIDDLREIKLPPKLKKFGLLFAGLMVLAWLAGGDDGKRDQSVEPVRYQSTGISRSDDNACADFAIRWSHVFPDKQGSYNTCVLLQQSMDAERRKLQGR